MSVDRRRAYFFQPWWEPTYCYCGLALLITSLAWIVGGDSRGLHPTLDTKEVTGKITKDAANDSSGDEKIAVQLTGPYYVFVLTTCSLAAQQAYKQMFLHSHLVHVLSGIASHATDVQNFRNTDNTVVFSNALHRASNTSFLLKLFTFNLSARILMSLGSCLAIILTSYLPPGHKTAELTLYIFLWSLALLLTLGQLAISIAGLAWLLLARRLCFARLMDQYQAFLNKIDVARGRSVPVPPYGSDTQQVLPALNPYISSPDLRLLLDLVSTQAGVGAALRCLAVLEADVADSWCPAGLQVEDDHGNIAVYWKDPLFLKYLPSPVVKVHYGLEVVAPSGLIKTRIISHEEVRFVRQTWRVSHPSVDMGGDHDFIYHEVLTGVEAWGSQVTVWTVVNGQLVAKTSHGMTRLEMDTEMCREEDLTRSRMCREERRMGSNLSRSRSNLTRSNIARVFGDSSVSDKDFGDNGSGSRRRSGSRGRSGSRRRSLSSRGSAASNQRSKSPDVSPIKKTDSSDRLSFKRSGSLDRSSRRSSRDVGFASSSPKNAELFESYKESEETHIETNAVKCVSKIRHTDSRSTLSGSSFEHVYSKAKTPDANQQKLPRGGGVKFQTEKSISDSNLNLSSPGGSSDAFSRKANNRKSLPIGHTNMAFSEEEQDSFMLI